MEWEGLEWVVVSELAGEAGVVPVATMPDERLRAERVSGMRRRQRERGVAVVRDGGWVWVEAD